MSAPAKKRNPMDGVARPVAHRNGERHPMDGKARPVARRHMIPVIRVTNPLDPRQHVREEVTWRKKATIADYFGGPTAQEFVISVSGKIVEPENYAKTYLDKTDNVVICPVPHGGDNGKAILRVVAMIVVAVFAQWAYGAMAAAGYGAAASGAVAAGVSIAGSLVVNAILPPPKPEGMTSEETSQSYGADGAKNTSLEGIPVPVCYGNFRMAGNIVGLYTENIADDNQVLYMLINAGEGPVASISNIELNGTPIEDFKDVEVQTRMGYANQMPIPWFSDSVAAMSKNQKLTQNWSRHDTQKAVDRVRLDVIAPQGLCNIDAKTGKTKSCTVDLEFEYRKAGTTTWQTLPVTGDVQDWRRTHAVPRHEFGYEVESETWHLYKQDGSNGKIVYGEQAQFDWNNDDATPVTDPKQLEYLAGMMPDSDGTARVPVFSQGASITGAKRSAVRRAYTSARLETAKYEIRYRRVTPDSTEDTVLDDLYMSDVNEITVDTLSYANTALVALKIRMTDQLSGLPQVTYMNGGRVINVYGVPPVGTVEQWYPAPSQNPAWIVWDALTHPRYGGAMPTSRLDFEAFREWAEYCDQQGLTWNGPVDTEMNVWDAGQMILRCGHAQLVNIGTRWTVAIERPSTPVMMFSVANMVENTYRETWLGTADRANEIDITYFDKDDSYKSRTIKVMDPAALEGGKKQRQSSVTLYGVVDAERAHKEGQLLLNMNRYILKTVSFSAPLEAIACTVGDLIYVQHDMTEWAVSGRFEAGSTATVMKLDRDVTMEAGKTYKILMHRSAVRRASGSILSIAGTSLVLSGYDGSASVKRIKVGAADMRVAGTFDHGSGHGVIVDDVAGLAVGQAYDLWDTDVIEEHGVLNQSGARDTITLMAPAANGAPEQFTTWMFGETEKLKKPFRIRSISGDSEYRRDIVALQYDEAVYDFNRYGSSVPVIPSNSPITPARNLSLYEETYVAGDQIATRLVASWQTPQVGMYAGADVIVSINGGTAATLPAAPSRTSAVIDAAKGDVVTVRVVSYDIFGKRSSLDQAPSATYTVIGELPKLEVGDVTGASYVWAGRECKISWRYNATTHSFEFGSEPNGADAGALDPQFKDYEIRVLSANGTSRRVEYTTDNSYIYGFDKNYADGIARRLKFEIRMRDRFNNLGNPAVLEAINPPPQITASTAVATFESATISYTQNGDPDFAGALLYVSEDESKVNNMAPDALVYRGPDSHITVPKLIFNTEYFYRLVPFDVFGETELVPAATLTFNTTHLNVDAIADGVLDDSKLIPGLKDRIDLIDAPPGTPGSVAGRIETVKTEIGTVIDTAKGDIDAIKNTIENPLTGLPAVNASISEINNITDSSTSPVAQAVRLIQAHVNDPATGLLAAAAAIKEINTVSATSDSAAARALSQIAAQVNDPVSGLPKATAAILALNDVSVTSDSALARTLASLEVAIKDPVTGLDKAHASIDSLNDVSVTSDSALARKFATMQVDVYDPVTGLSKAHASIDDLNDVSVTSNSAGARRIAQIDAQVNNPDTGLPAAQAMIADINDVSVTSNSAVARKIAAMDAQVNDPITGMAATYSGILSINDVSSTSTSAAARQLTALNATVNDPTTGLAQAHSSIVALNDVSATSTSAAAKALFQLSSRLNNIGGVSLEQAMTTSANAIEGLKGQYSVKIDSNGYVAGFGLSATTSTAGENDSEFIINADKFAMIMPSYPGVKPFTVGTVGGVPRVILSNALIGDATIGSAMIGNAQIGTLKIAGEAVTVPVTVTTLGNQARGTGKYNYRVINTGYVEMSEPGLVYILMTASMAFFKNSDVHWDFGIKVNNQGFYRQIEGRQAESAPVLSCTVPVPAGKSKIEVFWSADSQVGIGYCELFMMGVKK